MNYKFLLYVYFFTTLLAAKLNAQAIPYTIEKHPTVFSKIETHLQNEELDSVFNLCGLIIQKENKPEIKGIAHFYQGEAAALLNDFQHASASFSDAIAIFQSINFEKGLAMAYCNQGDVAFYQRQLNKADALYDQSLALAEKLGLNKVLVNIYQNKSMIYTDMQQHKSAMRFLKKALKNAYLIDSPDQIKNILNQVATNYHSLGELDSAIIYFHKTIVFKNKKNDNEGLISDYSALGNLYRERGSYIQAQEQLLKGLKVAEFEKDTFSMMTLFSEIGDVYAAQEGWNKSEEHYKKALELAQLKKRQFIEARCLSKLANIYQLQNQEKKAIEYYEQALMLYEKNNSKINAADVQINLSKLYKEGNQLEKAKTYLLGALEARSQSADKLSALTVKMALAEIEIISNNSRGGIKLINECLPEYRKMRDREGLKNGYLLLSDAYSKSNNHKLAFQFFKKYKNISDSLMAVDRAKAVSELELLYTTEKKDKEIAQQKAELEKQEIRSQERQSRNLLMAILGVFILMAVTTGLIYSRQVNRRLATKNKKIESQNVEIESERNRAESLLLNILPATVADELKQKGQATPKHFDAVTVMFTDFEGFTKIASSLPPSEIVSELNDCFLKFDEIAEQHNLEKIKTMGDAYMCAGGLPLKNSSHPMDAILAAKKIIAFVQNRNAHLATQGKPIWPIRIGIHTGELVAGVVGSKKFAYDIWGDTVNVASRMESSAGVGEINISEATYKLVNEKFHCKYRGEIEVKNKGKMGMYIVNA